MHPHIGDVILPMPSLALQVQVVGEDASSPEVTLDVVHRLFYGSLLVGLARPARMHLEAVVTRKVLEGLVERDIRPAPPLDHTGEIVVDTSLGHATDGQEGILVAA